MKFPNLCVVDTNVPAVANYAAKSNASSDVPDSCVLACVEAIEHVTSKHALVIDNGDEIFDEYRNNLSLSGQPGVGDKFLKWVHDYRWQLPANNLVTITQQGNTFAEFPKDSRLNAFDPSDKKFVAVANAHKNKKKPPILVAVDSDFYAYKPVLSALGITAFFVSKECEEYSKRKHQQKKSPTT